MRVVSPEEMREIERIAKDEYQFDETLIIENVGVQGCEFLHQQFLRDSPLNYEEIIVLVGKGHNGADGLAIARHLLEHNFSVRAFLLYDPSEASAINQFELNTAQKFGVKVSEIKTVDQLSSYFSQGPGEYFIIDAIFGTGLRLPLPDLIGDVISEVNRWGQKVVSIDIPSGVCGETGKVVGTAIIADSTITIGLPKLGHYISSGVRHKGQLKVISAGLPQKLLSGGDKQLIRPQEVAGVLGPRSKFAHKNSFGHCLCIGGSLGKSGAITLAAMAALKVGTGLVTAITWKESLNELNAQKLPEIMTGVIPHTSSEMEKFLKELNQYDSLVLGPGLSQSSEARKVVLKVLAHFTGPIVVDADGLNVLKLSEDGPVLKGRISPTLLTPHIGEFARLAQIDKTEVIERPIKCLRQLMEQTRCSYVLKGACSYLGLANGDTFFNDYPNDGMATGGSGDVLAGIIAGILAQNQIEGKAPKSDSSTFNQLVAQGVLIHSLAGQYAAEAEGERYMSASSIIGHLPKAFFQLKKNSPTLAKQTRK